MNAVAALRRFSTTRAECRPEPGSSEGSLGTNFIRCSIMVFLPATRHRCPVAIVPQPACRSPDTLSWRHQSVGRELMSDNGPARKARAVGINHVALEVGDIDAALAFYSENVAV